jgi:hypothetical protein
MNLLIFLLACYGMTMIVVYGKIFDKIRPKFHLFHCTMCMGFSVGIIINFLLYILNMSLFNDIIIGNFLSGCISSGTTYFLSKIVLDDGIRIVRRKE